jgi:pimeloyl-ACP methyl ester carboxylesterase
MTPGTLIASLRAMLYLGLLRGAAVAALTSLAWPQSCQRAGREEATRVHSAVTRPSFKAPDAIRMEVLDPNERPPVFVMRGSPQGPGRLVFLHGMCGHGLGYAQAFQFAASKYGTIIAPQGDISCGGVWSKWSTNLDALDARITRTFRALGHVDPIDDILVLGYSQGASRAEALVRKWPKRYTRLVLMGAPSAPSVRGLRDLRAAVTMAGERDRKDLMRAGSRSLLAVGVPTVFRIIPEATHGAMGPTPERTMGDVLTWIYENQRPATSDEPG